MDDRKDQPEPTMEEILASIRRIISEDAQEGGTDKQDGDEPSAAQEEPAPGPLPEPVSEPVAEEADKPGDDIFELTEVADEPEPDDIGIPETAPDDLAAPEPESVSASEPAPQFEPEPEPESTETPEPLASAPEPSQDEDAIVSPAPAAAATAAFAGLMGAMNRPTAPGGEMPIGNSGLTLEELVRQSIRPMLREWLDANLPPLVERLVKREIERMVRRAEN